MKPFHPSPLSRWAICCIAVWIVSCFPGVVLAGEVAGAPDEVAGAPEPSTERSFYGEGVRPTPWLEPEQERAGFHLPPGFEARLFASEPDIAKPLNLAFDSQGRLWMTQTTTYPHPAEAGEERGDAVLVLEDTDGDGRADRVTTFADGLNIPIGVLPYGDGCLCFSIPDVWYLRDTDGDGVCDRREKVHGPFDTSRDTHGLVNALRDGGDGWIYACHGFNNQSEIAGTDGHTVRLHSGNTFRFRPDGSRVEHVTRGQVNPFGMTRDDWGYWYSADCHSKPITQLIPGACYPSFGRPHDGLGFLPPMVDHLHGSTAISGITFVPEHSSIQPLRGQFLSGNVMTSRINRNRLTYQGATAHGEELPDFLTSDDPWFRPVDVRLGPDEHLYVADFYNRIIGHYEVPLDHPGRDRTSGRIWQIRYQGNPETKAKSEKAASTVAEELQVVAPLADSGALADHLIGQGWRDAGPRRRIALIRWAVEARLDAEGAGDGEIDGEPPQPGPNTRKAALLAPIRSALDDANPHVRRAAAEALGQTGSDEDVPALLALLASTPESDPVSRQTARIAVRDRLVAAPSGAPIWSMVSQRLTEAPQEEPAEELAFVLSAVDRPEVVPCLLDYLQQFPKASQADLLIRHAATLAPAEQLARCVGVARQIAGSSPSAQAALIETITEDRDAEALQQAAIRQWANEIAAGAIEAFQRQRAGQEFLIDWSSSDGDPWPRQQRPIAQGETAQLMSSHPRGESYRGTLRSDPFPAPASLSFHLSGHNGPPNEPDSGKNVVHLIAEASGETLRSASPPRSDTAEEVRWDLSDVVGDRVRIEVHDQDDGNAYAWVAVGQFDPAWLYQPATIEKLRLAVGLVRRLDLNEPTPVLREQLSDRGLSARLRLHVASALPHARSSAETRVLIAIASAAGLAAELAEDLIEPILHEKVGGQEQAVERLLRLLGSAEQRKLARSWLTEGADADRLLELAERGRLSTAVFTGEVEQMVRARLSEDQRQRLEPLLNNADSEAEDRIELTRKLERAIRDSAADLSRGRELYDKHCAACHQLQDRGKVVGPQLDGVTTRTIGRLLEDLVSPNQNVDAAFRTTTFLLDDGRVIVGVVQHEEAGEVRVADAEGKTISIAVDAIEQRQSSTRSLMPDNFGELLSAQDFADLVGYVRGAGGHR